MKIAVVGGGTAGFVATLILKKSFPTFTIDVIRSSKIGTIGVGEGSTEHWSAFMDFCGIPAGEMIRECDASFKSGIMFENWGHKNYLQNVHDPYVAEHLGMPMVYGKLIGENVDPKEFVGEYTWNNQTPFNKFMEERINDTGVSQYHFNTNKLNDYLTGKAKMMGCNIFDDEIDDVIINEQGQVKQLKSKNKTYEYDFYVDCTGFARLLIGKLGSKWQSYSKFLKMKEAIVFPTREETEIPMWTLARAMNSGWMFRIPVWGRKGNGYIFDSDHITADEAKIEAEKYLGFEVDVAKHIKFNPGAVDKPWINNVCAIGLSASFVEPLEASSIGTSINQSFILANRIIHYNQDVIDRYNKEVDAIMNNIRDFIVLHYISPRRDTEFWRSVAEVELPDTLKANLNMWKHRLPIIDDFTSYTKKVLFNEYNHTLVMYGMGLFDQEKIMAQYDSVPQEAKHYTERQIQTKLDYDKVKTIPHKMMLDLIRRLS
tara:strand:- start:2706 stop:4163 length:1458 start_codon:yes stop_codon:yes gene_type:complete